MLDCIADISHQDGRHIDFIAAARSGLQGVIHRATQGGADVDPHFSANKHAILDAGPLFGSFHFGDGSDGGAQAGHYLSVASPATHHLLALDLEENEAGPSMSLAQARIFVTTIFTSVENWPVLYAGHRLKELLGPNADPVLANRPLWLAQSGRSAVLPAGWKKWSLWQCTDGAQRHSKPVKGIGYCDRSRFDGTADEPRACWATVSPD